MKNKIIIFGSRGMLGNYVFKYLKKKNYNVEEINRPEYDAEIGNFKSLLSLKKIKNLNKNDILINCIGLLPHVFNDNSISNKGCNEEIYRKYFLINSIFPHNLEKLKLMKSVKVVNITSDCVFRVR